jgi:hypothetical protein
MSPVFTTSKQYQLGINLITQYQGPGDIQAAKCWGGLRAYSLATAGTKFINLRASGNNATADFNTLPNGLPDTASIGSFLTANGGSLFVTKLYDQSGNGLDWSQSTAASQPAFVLNGLGSLPIMNGNGAFLSQASTFSLTVPWSFATVALTTDTTTLDVIGWDTVNSNGIAFSSGTSAYLFIAGAGSANGAITTSAWYSLVAGGSGVNTQQIYVNGVAGSGAGVADNNFGSTSLNYMTRSSGVQPLQGSSVEVGLFPRSPFDAAWAANMTANARAFWGI